MRFADEKNKIVLFEPNKVYEFKKFFDENTEAKLIISATELTKYQIDEDFFISIVDTNIHRLRILGSWDEKERFSLRYTLKIKNLIELENRSVILDYDFIDFPFLEVLMITWDKKYKNLLSLKKLRQLGLWSYKPKNCNLMELSELYNLEELRIIQSNITSIKGIENLKNLKSLIFVANQNMSFIDINTVFESVESLYIEGCKKIDDSFVKLFPNLKKLEFFNNSTLESLKNVLVNLKHLEHLNIYETKILEEDNSYWRDYKNIKLFNFQNQKHFKLKLNEFENRP